MQIGIRLLLVVALLLPLRGALAAAGFLCHSGSALPAAVALADAGPADGLVPSGASHGGGAPHDDRDAVHGLGHAAHHHHDDGTQGTPVFPGAASCPFCTAVCGVPPLPAAPPVAHASAAPGAERFPVLTAPRSSSAYGAPERPPRAA